MVWTYRMEAKGIQSWILATNKLREMAGASEIVHEVASFVREQATRFDATVIQAAAGAATLSFTDRDALASFASMVPVAVDRRAPGLQFIQAWMEGGAEACWERLQQRLRRVRNQPVPALPEAGPLLLRAGRSGEPAVGRDSAGATLDRGMRAKQRAFLHGRRRIAQSLLGDQLDFADDIESFGDGYCAVLHADANSIGQILGGSTNLDRKLFSEALEAATKHAAREALAVVAPTSNGRLPARAIVLGGDDFTAVLRASDALAVAERYLRQFEAVTASKREALSRPLTACVGVAIIKPGWPFHAAHNLAEELCRAAKAKLRGSGGPDRSGLAFHRVTAALSSSWEDIRERELATDGWAGFVPQTKPDGSPTGRRAVLSQNPYALDELDAMHALAAAVGELPRGALRRWATAAHLSTADAQDLWQRMRQVSSPRQADALTQLDEALRRLGADPATGWCREAGTTPLRDALEWVVATRPAAGRDSREDR